MPKLPDPFGNSPDPLTADIRPMEAIQHPAYGKVSAWIDEALKGPPSPGTIGRMELLRHWDQLPGDKRQMLLIMAREMVRNETE
ncbi:hypothetical protein [Roseomonas populi]|uniref:Uncharacterized protein n=1 Tax=Roseomonas populi TaxID=3121582 RepID=A0ABT1XAY5_9PROT|nr:hypothetical protein [Roseomonas pecuniae]MCR0985273.1 hypothetical protein [Roseomonas pecuniae]